ncbi:MAG: hypothetical protein CVV41_09285 [Candidatus Riflebacteria bacterium HGW-Riflebacteria-1]|jgi:hypothetical protein|nr:MAG: hypothetical protein CVV41_09285 [Candidatus Riflebacteria bacterium HGW-Riflebacteria-1]
MTQASSNLRTQTFLTSAADRAEGQLSPVFGYVVLVCLWAGSFLLMSMDMKGPPLSDRVLFSSLVTFMAATVGFFLFQGYELSITTHSVKWENHIIPRVWVERWEEPIQNYKGISLLQTTPVSDFWPPKYVVARLFYPVRIAKKNMRESDHRFNERKFIVVYLKHSYDRSRDVCLKNFAAEDVDEVKKYCLYASEKLNLVIDN